MSDLAQFKNRKWTKGNHYVTTDTSGVPIPKLIEIFNSDVFYWASAMPAESMEAMLRNSLCFCLFNSETDDFVGLARCVTDYTTFLYLTDVWVDPKLQGQGLGTFLVTCAQEVIVDMPYLRRSILFTTSWEKSVPFYERHMEMEVCELKRGTGLAMMERKGKGHPTYGKPGLSYD